jgi:hypothetical protein
VEAYDIVMPFYRRRKCVIALLYKSEEEAPSGRMRSGYFIVASVHLVHMDNPKRAAQRRAQLAHLVRALAWLGDAGPSAGAGASSSDSPASAQFRATYRAGQVSLMGDFNFHHSANIGEIYRIPRMTKMASRSHVARRQRATAILANYVAQHGTGAACGMCHSIRATCVWIVSRSTRAVAHITSRRCESWRGSLSQMRAARNSIAQPVRCCPPHSLARCDTRITMRCE